MFVYNLSENCHESRTEVVYLWPCIHTFPFSIFKFSSISLPNVSLFLPFYKPGCLCILNKWFSLLRISTAYWDVHCYFHLYFVMKCLVLLCIFGKLIPYHELIVSWTIHSEVKLTSNCRWSFKITLIFH